MIRHFLFILLGIAIGSCNRETITKYKDVNALPVSLIYTGDTVYHFMNAKANVNADIAQSYIKKGDEVKSTHPEKAIYFYKRAITLAPAEESYLKLAKALEATGFINELNQLYNFLVFPFSYRSNNGKYTSTYIFNPPSADLYYEFLVSSIIKNQSLWGEDAYIAKELNFDTERIKSKLIHDPRIGMDTASMVFKNILLQFLTFEEFEKAAKTPEMFRNFVSSAVDTSSTFSISEKQVGNFNYHSNTGSEENYMQNDFSGIYKYYLIEVKEQPNLWFRYNLTNTIRLSNKFTTLICAIDTSDPGSPPEMRNIYYRLVTYNPTMEIIDHKVVAVHSGEQLWTVDFRKNKFTIHYFRRTFRKPYKKGDYDNDVTGLVLQEDKNYEINDAGYIIEIPPVSSM